MERKGCNKKKKIHTYTQRPHITALTIEEKLSSRIIISATKEYKSRKLLRQSYTNVLLTLTRT